MDTTGRTRPNRRGFLRLAAGAAAVCFAGRECFAADKKKHIPIGLQLYSVRADCGKDFPGTIEAVAEMGYEGVEFAGYYGRDAKALRKLLDDNGLKCCGTHTHINTLLGDNLKRTIEFHKTLGNKFLMVPSLPGKYGGSKKKWTDTAKMFTEIAEKAADDGMVVGYHNHSKEFKPIDGETPWDILFSNAGKNVAMQLDTGNCMAGKGDPVHYLKKYADRAATIHCKEFARSKKNACVGDGLVKWDRIFKIAEKSDATQWYIVEQGRYPSPPLECVQRCLQAMHKMCR